MTVDYAARRISAGLCIRCAAPVDVRRDTGEPYRSCRRCRIKAAKYAQDRYQSKPREPRCADCEHRFHRCPTCRAQARSIAA